MADPTYTPIQFPAWLGQMIANQQSPKAMALNAFNQSFFPGANQGIKDFIGAVRQKRKNQQWAKTINELTNNPNASPQLKSIAPLLAQNPSLAGQLLPETLKNQTAKPEFQPVPGMLSKSGRPLVFDKFTGQMKEGSIPAQSTGYGAMMGPVRKGQYTLQDLPSNQGPNTAAGAAYQVKVAARQGKSLISKATTPQAIALSSADLGRAVQRSAPLAETIGASNFADNLTTKFNLLRQKLTSDPKSTDIPKIRKELYDMFDELDKAATPWVQNQLDYMAENGFNVSEATRKKQLGLDLPPIQFVGDVGGNAPAAGWSIQKVQ